MKYDMGLLKYDERILQHPEDSVAYLNRGIWHHWNGSFGKALTDFDTSISIDSTIAYAFCARASLQEQLVPTRHSGMADGDRGCSDALKVSEQAGQLIGDWRHRLYLQVLAAAHAENAEIEEAIVVQTRALELALTNGPRSQIAERLGAISVR